MLTITVKLITFSLAGIQIQVSIDKMVIILNFTVGGIIILSPSIVMVGNVTVLGQ